MTEHDLQQLNRALSPYKFGSTPSAASLPWLFVPHTGKRTAPEKRSSGVSTQQYAISASATEGVVVETADGQRAMLVVLDADGEAISADVSREVWRTAVQAYRAFLTGTGHLRVHSSPPGQFVTP